MSAPRTKVQARRASRRPRRPAPHLPQGGRNWIILLVAVAVAVVVGILIWAMNPDPEAPTAKAAATSIAMNTSPTPVPSAPAEWQSTPKWSTPPLMQDTGQVPVIGGDKVGFVTADRNVVLVSAAGSTLWSAALPDAELIRGRALTPTRVDGRTVLALQMAGLLVWWDVETGEPGQVAVPSDPAVTYFGGQPLIPMSSTTVGVIVNGQVQEVDVPPNATAFAARVDGSVVAASPQGRWSLQPGAAPAAAAPWQGVGPDQAVIPIAWSGDRLIAVQKPTRDGQIVEGTTKLVVYDQDSTTPQWSADITLPLGQVSWRPAPSGRWGILNDVLVDLEARRAQQIPGWTTTAVAADRALGQINNQRVLVGPAIPPGILAQDEGFPEDTIRLDESQVGAMVRTQTQADGHPEETVSVLAPRSR